MLELIQQLEKLKNDIELEWQKSQKRSKLLYDDNLKYRERINALESDRRETISVLRDICSDFGDNDWPDDLNLTDVIEKHLAKHLHERYRSIDFSQI